MQDAKDIGSYLLAAQAKRASKPDAAELAKGLDPRGWKNGSRHSRPKRHHWKTRSSRGEDLPPVARRMVMRSRTSGGSWRTSTWWKTSSGRSSTRRRLSRLLTSARAIHRVGRSADKLFIMDKGRAATSCCMPMAAAREDDTARGLVQRSRFPKSSMAHSVRRSFRRAKKTSAFR